LLNRSLRRAVLATTLLLPTLATVLVAPAVTMPAAADSWHQQDGPLQGQSWVQVQTDNGNDIWAHVGFLPAALNNCAQIPDYDNTNSRGNWNFNAGDTASLCVNFQTVNDSDPSNGDIAGDGHWTSVTVKAMKWNGAQLGTASWTSTDYATIGDNGFSAPIPFRFDTDPLNGTTDASYTGTVELYISVTVVDANGTTTHTGDSRGVGTTNDPGYHAQGVVQSGAHQYLIGSHPDGNSLTELTGEQASTGVNKNYSLVRDYQSTWAVPGARDATWAGQGKAIIWSANPASLGWTGTTSPWAKAAADTTTINSIVQSLQNSGNSGGVPMFLAVSQEPHDNASDTTQGWDSGHSDRKCGSSTSPSGGTTPCLGTSTEFKSMYSALKTAQSTECNASGGTTGTLGFPCGKVYITYIGVGSNMTPGTTTVGDQDIMRPSDGIYDVLGSDVYNWGCFRKAAGTCTDSTHGNNNEWKSLQTLVEDTSTNNYLLNLANVHNKPLIIPEIGSAPGCNGTETTNGCNGSSTNFDRGTWMTDAYNFLTTDPLAHAYLIGFAYFHALGTYDWRFIDTGCSGGTCTSDVDNRGLSAWKSGFGSNSLFLSSAANYKPQVDAGDSYQAAGSGGFQYDGTLPVIDRNHSGTELWTPRQLDFNSGWDSTANRAWMIIGFTWYQQEHRLEVTQGVGIEIDAQVDCNWARAQYANWKEGYQGSGWDTNIPGAALPYEDTIFKEACQNGTSGKGHFGFGMLNPEALVNGQHYYAKFAFDTIPGYGSCGCSSDVQLTTKVGVVYDAWVPGLDRTYNDCNFTSNEISNWNVADDAHLAIRQQAGWCDWIDWTHNNGDQVSPAGLLTTGTYYPSVNANYLYNQDMGNSGGYSTWGTGSHFTVYCNDPYPAFEPPCFTQSANDGPGQGAVYQDTGWQTGDSKTAEAAIRCRSGSACYFHIGIWATGISPDEYRYVTTSIPNDGAWYVCRLDMDHYTGTLPEYATHSTFRWEIVHDVANQLMDIDFSFLGDATHWQDPEYGFAGYNVVGVGHADVGNPCTKQI